MSLARGLSFFVVALTLVALAGKAETRAADRGSEAKAQVEFGILVAQNGLWREATYRFKRAVELDPTYAAGYNNLAVAYEQQGLLERARKTYEKALMLAPDNTFIRQNFELFKDIYDRAYVVDRSR